MYQNEIVKRIFDTTPDMLGILDENGKILECNHHVEHNTGYTKKELIGKIGPIDLIDEKDRERAMQEFGRVKTDGINQNVHLFMKRKDGSTFPSLWSGSTLRDCNNDVLGYLVTGKDLSEIHTINEALAEEKAKRLMTVGQLASRFSHDIRNPLGVIQNACQLLKLSLQDTNGKASSLIDLIDKSAVRISYQIDDILNFVRSTDIKKEPCSINQILHSCMSKISIPVNVSVHMPSKDLEVECDRIKLEIVFENLIKNSIQAINSNNGEIFIDIKKEEDYDSIKISDSGPGIPPDLLSQIFEPLFTTKRSGTGLGLPTCKNLVEQHRWTIHAELPSSFTIKIPHR